MNKGTEEWLTSPWEKREHDPECSCSARLVFFSLMAEITKETTNLRQTDRQTDTHTHTHTHKSFRASRPF
jgi:hypothetical protein